MSNIDFKEITVFEGKTFDSLLKDIYENSKNKSTLIQSLIEKLSPLIKDTGDASLLVPLIAEYLDIDVKNDDQLIKLATVVQRFLKGAVTSNNESDFGLTSKEREELEQAWKDSKIVPMTGTK